MYPAGGRAGVHLGWSDWQRAAVETSGPDLNGSGYVMCGLCNLKGPWILVVVHLRVTLGSRVKTAVEYLSLSCARNLR